MLAVLLVGASLLWWRQSAAVRNDPARGAAVSDAPGDLLSGARRAPPARPEPSAAPAPTAPPVASPADPASAPVGDPASTPGASAAAAPIPAPSALTAASALPPSTTVAGRPAPAAAPREFIDPPPAPRKVTPTPATRQGSPTTTAQASPRQRCGGRTEFALYRCMQQQCAQPRWRAHPQCTALRRTDRAPG
jgi:non-specific serine/threonine protein kinase